jgi:hypothetical protein
MALPCTAISRHLEGEGLQAVGLQEEVVDERRELHARVAWPLAVRLPSRTPAQLCAWLAMQNKQDGVRMTPCMAS